MVAASRKKNSSLQKKSRFTTVFLGFDDYRNLSFSLGFNVIGFEIGFQNYPLVSGFNFYFKIVICVVICVKISVGRYRIFSVFLFSASWYHTDFSKFLWKNMMEIQIAFEIFHDSNNYLIKQHGLSSVLTDITSEQFLLPKVPGRTGWKQKNAPLRVLLVVTASRKNGNVIIPLFLIGIRLMIGGEPFAERLAIKKTYKTTTK